MKTIIDKIDILLNDDSNKVKAKCMECGKEFMSALSKNREVKCPKCHSVDIEIYN